MTLKTQLTDDMKTAMKAGDKIRLGVIRLINAAIKQREVDERIELDDAAVLAVLEKLVNIDLRAFGPGYATRTGLHHMAVFVIRRGAGKVSFLGMRSAAGSLWHVLASAVARQEGLMG